MNSVPNWLHKIFFLLSLSNLFFPFASLATSYPLTIQSCDRQVVFQHPPQRAISNDINLTEMMVALGLQPHMVGYSSVTITKNPDPKLLDALKGIPEVAKRYPNLEVLLNANADFYFAGWNYGMRVGGEVTPETLAPLGIQVYELTESCSRIMATHSASFDDVYRDLLNLGKIFDVEARSEALVFVLRQRVERITKQTQHLTERPRVFLYDVGSDRPLTSGRLGMPQALLTSAGAENIAHDVQASWTQVSWESVIERNPEVIVIVDYGGDSVAQKIAFLQQHPALKSVDAIRHQRFIALTYGQVTPSVSNVDALEQLAQFLHPQLFGKDSH